MFTPLKKTALHELLNKPFYLMLIYLWLEYRKELQIKTVLLRT